MTMRPRSIALPTRWTTWPSRWTSARVGQTLTVTYNPADPGRSIGTSLAEANRDVKMSRPVIYIAVAFFWGVALWSLLAARNG